MNEQEFLNKLANLEKSIDSLKFAITEVKKQENQDQKIFEIYRDSSIQRFEYTYELSWKMMKFLCINQEWDFEARTSAQAIKSAFKSWYIDNIKLWFKMIELRNKSSHEYEENIAYEIYDYIFELSDEIQKFYELIKTKYGQWYFNFN